MRTANNRPIVANVLQTWCVPPGMSFGVARDAEGRIWIVESCPAGTKFWTAEQAAQLPRGNRTGPAIEAALRLAESVRGGTADRDEAERGLFCAVPNLAPKWTVPHSRRARISMRALVNA